MASNTSSAGHAIVQALEAHGVDRVFEVPGESYLDVLDGLYDAGIHTVVCRQEGGATYAAEADGKLTGRPGVAMVTRGPGAANAMIGIHQAWQDGAPLVLFVGLVPIGNRHRESFQEFDIRGWFGTTTKRVLVLDEPGRASAIVAEAFFAARSGRPGPVVIGLPEDVIRMPFDGVHVDPLLVADGAISAPELRELGTLLESARRPLVMTGGNEWSPVAAAAMTDWLERTGVPAITQWRAGGAVPSDSPAFAGTLGYRRSDTTAAALDEADVLLAVGTMLGEIDTDGYQLRQRSDARTVIISIDAGRTGHSGPVTQHILARPDVFAAALADLEVTPRPEWWAWCQRLHAAQERYADPGEATDEPSAPTSMTAVMRELASLLPRDALITTGAGNHTAWAQRFLPTRTYPALISTRNGSMGYSIPSALAASLRYPERLVVTVTGDGEFTMNGNELATACQHGAAPLVVLMDNGQYGTIRAHQERSYPGRISGTQLTNPDFAAIAEAMGAFGARIERIEHITEAVTGALHAVQEDHRPALLHVIVDPAVLLPPVPADLAASVEEQQ
jgi:acetolactate synthase I/II/III large subunit